MSDDETVERSPNGSVESVSDDETVERSPNGSGVSLSGGEAVERSPNGSGKSLSGGKIVERSPNGSEESLLDDETVESNPDDLLGTSVLFSAKRFSSFFFLNSFEKYFEDSCSFVFLPSISIISMGSNFPSSYTLISGK